MSSETKKRHVENHDILFNNAINREVPITMYLSRKEKLTILYNKHSGKKPSYFYGPPTPGIRLKKASNSGCYIATMVYGDYGHPQVLVLREFRDDFLAHYILGRSFIRFYYKYSPGWVKALEHNKMINKSIEKALNAFIKIYK